MCLINFPTNILRSAKNYYSSSLQVITMSSDEETPSPTENTVQSYNPHKVSLLKVLLKSFFLGAVILVNLYHVLQWSQSSNWWLHLYFVHIGLFHALEFISAVLWNPTQVDDDSFILEDTDLWIVYGGTLVEYFVRGRYVSWWKLPIPPIIGFVIAIIGQTTRTLAMYTARQSFTHYIQTERGPQHILVTHGIYSVLRHPSYFGYFWWFVGTEIVAGNPLVLTVGVYKLWDFFNRRIVYEEDLLILFFGVNYIDYREKTWVGIPAIE